MFPSIARSPHRNIPVFALEVVAKTLGSNDFQRLATNRAEFRHPACLVRVSICLCSTRLQQVSHTRNRAGLHHRHTVMACLARTTIHFLLASYTAPPGGLLLICGHTSKVLRHLVKLQPGIAHAALFVFGQAAEIGVTVS